MRIAKYNYGIFAVLIVLCFAFVIRIWNLSTNPAGFFCDEASIGVNAFSILATGNDEHGNHLPLFFQAFGEFKSPIQTYSTIPFITLFGLNEFSIRLVSVFYGVLGIIAVYLLSLEIFQKKSHYAHSLSLISAVLLAISPWHIHISRVSLEGLAAFVFFTTLGLYVFLKSQNKPFLMLVSITLFAIAMYSYFPARIFIPLFGIGLAILYYQFFFTYKKVTVLCIILLSFILTPMLLHLIDTGSNRWNQVSIFSNHSHNQSIVNHITHNYLSHFSYDFLFTKGDIDMPGQFITRHSVRGFGELYLFQLPLLFSGILYLFIKNKKIFGVLTVWLLLYPVGSMFTLDQSAQATRSIIGVIPFQIISSIGILGIESILRNTRITRFIILCFFCVIGSISFFQYMQKYFFEYPQYSSNFWGWQYGAREVVTYFADNQKQYDETIMESSFNAPEIFFKFYAPYECYNCKIGEPHTLAKKHFKQLFAVTPYYLSNHPEIQLAIQQTIYYPNGDIAFVIGEIVQ